MLQSAREGRDVASQMSKSPPSTQVILRHWREAVPDDRLAHLVKDATRALVRALQMRLGEHAVSFGHWTFLRILWESDGLTQRELSEQAGVMEPTTFSARQGDGAAWLCRPPQTRRRPQENLCLSDCEGPWLAQKTCAAGRRRKPDRCPPRPFGGHFTYTQLIAFDHRKSGARRTKRRHADAVDARARPPEWDGAEALCVLFQIPLIPAKARIQIILCLRDARFRGHERK